MKRALMLTVLAGGLAPSFANAERFLQPPSHWFQPIEVHFDQTDVPSIGETDTVAGSTERAVVAAAAQTWADVACTDATFVFPNGTNADGEYNHIFSAGQDGVNAIIFEDNTDDCEAGVLAYNYSIRSATTEVVNGVSFREILESDVSFCNGINFGTPAEVDSPTCVGQYDMQGIALHELGHGLGYKHSCESTDVCGDPELLGAVMYWSVAACDGGQRSPNSWDLETHSISYGLGASSDLAVTNGSGGLPLDVTFAPVVIASASVISVDWEFGDATEETTAGGATHTYVSEGRYSVGATIHANSPACGGDFTEKVRKVDAVIACNELTPEFRYEKDGKRVKFFSETIGAAAGCLQTLNWDFGDGASANVKNPIHVYGAGGDYTVTLTASGPSGTSDPFTRDVKVSSGGGGGLLGCSLDGSEAPSTNTAAAAGVLGIAVVMSLATANRRRSH